MTNYHLRITNYYKWLPGGMGHLLSALKRSSLERRGMALLLVVVLLSALLSISIGVFNVVFGQIKISGEIADSFVAFYAADQGIEKILYQDRSDEDGICPVAGANCFRETDISVASGGCYTVRVSKVGGNTEIIAAGQYRCGASPSRVVKRGFQVTY